MQLSRPIPRTKGTYILVLSLPEPASIRIGKLGRFSFIPGCYLYVGSAFGPGGLAARIHHHVTPAPKPHWHIDYFKTYAKIVEIWYQESPVRLEHEWANHLASLDFMKLPVAGLGSSDCQCPAHFFRVA